MKVIFDSTYVFKKNVDVSDGFDMFWLTHSSSTSLAVFSSICWYIHSQLTVSVDERVFITKLMFLQIRVPETIGFPLFP